MGLKHFLAALCVGGGLIACLAPAPALAADWAVGQAVQAWNSDWYDGVIVEIGTGSYAGYYKVRFEGPSGPTYQYVSQANLRPRQGTPASAATAAAPRPGRYICLGYNGGAAGTFRWYLELDGSGGYRQSTPNLKPGRYSFDGGSSTLSFDSGPYADNGWFGRFSVEREGRTHKIVLRALASEAQGPRVDEYANIYCTNSTDS